MYKIKIDDYMGGFGYDEINCNNHCIIAAAGSYVEEYYVWITLLFACEMNWGEPSAIDNDWFIFHNQILKKFGLYIQADRVSNNLEYVNYIIDKIRSKCPIILFLSSAYIPWNNTHYKKESEALHGIIICGYDEERELFYIKDNSIINSSGFDKKNSISTNTMWEFCLPYEIVFDMIKKSNNYLQSIHNNYCNKIFSLVRQSPPLINNSIELFEFILHKYDVFRFNRFANYINSPLSKLQASYLADNVTLMANRLDFWGNYNIIFRILDVFCFQYGEQKIMDELSEVRATYMRNRNIMFNLKTKSIIMDKPLGRNKIDELIKNIYEDDSILFFYFKRILLTALSNNK